RSTADTGTATSSIFQSISPPPRSPRGHYVCPLADDLTLFGDKARDAGRVDEIRFVRRRDPPLGRTACRLERGHVIKPELGHAVERRQVRWIHYPMALDETPQPGDAPADRRVHLTPITSEFVEGHPRPPGDAIDKFDDGWFSFGPPRGSFRRGP